MEKELFSIALGVVEPLYIEEIEFDTEAGELHIRLDFERGGKFRCPGCGAEGQGVHDTEEKRWRHLNFFQYRCYLHLRTPRVDCEGCGPQLWVPPWGRAQSGFTLLFEAFVVALGREMPMARIGELVGEHDTRIWRIVKWHVEKAKARKSYKGVRKVGVDETSSRRGHNYVTVFADMESGEVVHVTEGKDAATVGSFAAALEAQGGDPRKVKEVAMDMSPAFKAGVAEHLPKAQVTYDKYHVIAMFNKVLDEVRRWEQKLNPLLKRTRYVWLKNPGNLTASQREALDGLGSLNLRTAKVYQMKLVLQDIYRSAGSPMLAREALRKWLAWAVRSRLEAVKEFAKTLKSHMEGILRYFTTRLTSGAMEGINSRIQEIKRRARGFRNIDNFITMIYLEASNLDLNTAPFFTHSK